MKFSRSLLSLGSSPVRHPTGATRPTSRAAACALEEQLERLAQFGLSLNPGVTLDDLLYSWERQEYEHPPYDAVLFMLGSEVEREPWGRRVCDRVWNFDTECIEDTGDYVKIVQNFCRIALMPDLITDVEDYVNIEQGTAWLRYTVDGVERYYDIVVQDDWADPETVGKIMQDIEREGNRFYAKDNGQASIWFYLAPATAEQLNRLTGNALKPNV